MKEFRHLSERPPLLRSPLFYVVITVLAVLAGALVVGLQRSPGTAATTGGAATSAATSSGSSPPAAPASPAEPASPAGTAGPAPSVDAAFSGEPMPVGDLAGWRQIFADDFGRDELGDDWSTYEGRPGGDPYTVWHPEHVLLEDNTLLLAAHQRDGQWTTGGVSNWPVTQTYGRWDVRFRAQASDEMTYHFLLWPQAENWPPEIDFLEDFSGDRSKAAGFLHYLEDGERKKVQRDVEADFTDWHTAGVVWEADRITFTLDGEPWGVITGDAVPDEPMWLALQAQAGGCERSAEFGFPSCPSPAGVPDLSHVQIDWVVVYAPE